MKKRYTEEQIMGFLREAGAGVPIVELCRRPWRYGRPAIVAPIRLAQH